MPKSKPLKRGGYEQWKCRRCNVQYTEGSKKQAINFRDNNCSSEVALFDGDNWHYMMMFRPHNCADGGIGVADFMGLAPTKN